jgi:hypothetical protein
MMTRFKPRVLKPTDPIMTLEERDHAIIPGMKSMYIVLSTPELTVDEKLPDDWYTWNQEQFDAAIPGISKNLAQRFATRAMELEKSVITEGI